MEYKCETDRDAQDSRDVYAIQFSDDVRYVDFQGNDFDGVALTMADQGANTLGTAVVQVKDILAMARELEGYRDGEGRLQNTKTSKKGLPIGFSGVFRQTHQSQVGAGEAQRTYLLQTCRGSGSIGKSVDD